jgi:hypothetical protein
VAIATTAAFARIEETPRSERIGKEIAVVFQEDHPILCALASVAFIESTTLNGEIAVFVGLSNAQAVETALRVGPRTLYRVLEDTCLKKVESPSALLNVNADKKVTLPSNLESASDSLVYKLLILYSKLGVEMEVGDTQVAVPNFSQGWGTNMSYMLDLLLRIVSNLLRPESERENLPGKVNSDIGNAVISLIVYKWANRTQRAAYLKDFVKQRGNLSETAFRDAAKGWGTPCDGNIAGRMLSSIYQLTGILSSHAGISAMMNRSHFQTGADIRRSIAPPRQLVEKVGKATKVVSRGEINVMRFDHIRFLVPSERAQAKNFNESADAENWIRDFDAYEVQDRNYPALQSKLKEHIGNNANMYFKLRRAARQRLYAVKEVRREAKQPDQIADSEFASNKFLDSVIEMAESTIIDLGRRKSVLDILRSDIVTASLGSDNSESEDEASTLN